MLKTHGTGSESIIPFLAEVKVHQARSLFDRIYEMRETEPFRSPRRALLDDAASRAVRILEARRQEERRVRYMIVPDGRFSVIEWVPNYDGRDRLTGHRKHTLARFNSFEDAERYVAGEYDEQTVMEAQVEIEGPFCPVRLPLYFSSPDELMSELPF
jgi:hypothetical protein